MRILLVVTSSLLLTAFVPPPAGDSVSRRGVVRSEIEPVAGTTPAPGESRPHADDLTALLHDRLATVVREIEILESQQETGNATLGDFADARKRLLRSKLDLADSNAERLAAWDEYVSYLKKREAHVEARMRVGEINPIANVQARYDRLDAEIELFRLRQAVDAER